VVGSVLVGTYHHGTFEAVAFQDGEQEVRRVFGGKVLVGIQAQVRRV